MIFGLSQRLQYPICRRHYGLHFNSNSHRESKKTSILGLVLENDKSFERYPRCSRECKEITPPSVAKLWKICRIRTRMVVESNRELGWDLKKKKKFCLRRYFRRTTTLKFGKRWKVSVNLSRRDEVIYVQLLVASLQNV